MFFGLFGITNRASSIIGPNVVQAVINANDGNSWMGFPFLFALCAAASIGVWCVDVEKGRLRCRDFVEERKVVRVAREAGMRREDVLEGAARGDLDIDGIGESDPVSRDNPKRRRMGKALEDGNAGLGE